MDQTMSQRTRTELLSKMRRHYRSAGAKYKGKLLDQAQEMLGYHRKAAIRALRAPRVSPRAADYYRATDPLRAEETSALVATDLASNRLCLRATTGGDVAGVD